VITEFTGEHRYLSNFYPCTINFRGITYPSAEHAFQAQKTSNEADRLIIAGQATPRDAKHYGRQVELVPTWEQDKKVAMLLVVLTKFRQHGTLLKQLLDTGDQQLIEGNRWHDNYWGSCTCKNCLPDIGTNMLGKLLMVTRAVYSPDA
jgi:hypothetical protein